MNESKIDSNQFQSAKLKTLDSKNLESTLKTVYEQILELLMLNSKDLGTKEFLLYLNLLENILVLKRIKIESLNDPTMFVLIYYFIGCELKKRNRLKGFNLNCIKSEKFKEISLEYFPTTLSTSSSCGNDFCKCLDSLIEELRAKRSLIGVVK
ncbi:DUF3890 domain-containing protein [Borreliella tanukii]|uniref:DUF3890 domain-containing protein n=1 Tax=Borreliella tanukii TaxID=56146 RepID=UPI002649726A|nr:DUF3890 domain-containing protein [Borreliella tanukii]WKC79404.1 DUF3890 domain-containing protein [Borreliella tanukii]WKC80323.1 DUF3890 domain-containing protein [Borreliella tanukii]WKC81236.1 DUF3890 domain-containing protein [Borreliella tanukii]WKC82151.1 DUF3890 domain-containing protein [Borreliella tanukii]